MSHGGLAPGAAFERRIVLVTGQLDDDAAARTTPHAPVPPTRAHSRRSGKPPSYPPGRDSSTSLQPTGSPCELRP